MGKRPKKKTPRPAWRHAPPQGSSAPPPKRCARQNPRCPSYLIKKSRTAESCKLELTHSPFQNTRFPRECEDLEAVDWSAQLIHKKNPNRSHTGSPTPSASGKLPKFHASLDTGEKMSSHAIGAPPTPLCRSWLAPELTGQVPMFSSPRTRADLGLCSLAAR